MSEKLSRRNLLRSVGSAAGAATGVGAISSSIQARENTPDGGSEERWSVEFPRSGFGPRARFTWHTDRPDIPFYNYVGSVHAEDLCYWSHSACIYLGAISSVATLNGVLGIIAGSGCKVVQESGCRLRQDLSRATPYDFNWVYLYIRPEAGGAGPDILFIPKP